MPMRHDVDVAAPDDRPRYAVSMDATAPDTTQPAAQPSRADRLKAQQDAALAWARTATTDDMPGDLAPPVVKD
jgi:hypothetical protein